MFPESFKRTHFPSKTIFIAANGCRVNSDEALCRVNSGDARFAFPLSGRPSHESLKQTKTRMKGFLICYLMQLQWQTSMLDSASDYARNLSFEMSNMGAYLLASFKHKGSNDASFCMSPVSNECPCAHRLVWATTNFRILLDVWPSATACRAQSDVFDSESHDRRRWLDALSHPLSYTPELRQWHTRICSAVEGRQDAKCENCAWWAESWASEIQQVIRSWANSGRPTQRDGHSCCACVVSHTEASYAATTVVPHQMKHVCVYIYFRTAFFFF